MHFRVRTALAISLFAVGSLFAGDIQSVGNGSVVVNISGTQDGAAAWGPNQIVWYQPFNTTGKLTEYTFAPGTYSFQLVNNDRSSSFYNQKAEYEAWTWNIPWSTEYLLFDQSAATNPNEGNFVRFGDDLTSASDAAGAFNQAVAAGLNVNDYTFQSKETVIFSVPDYYLPDNNGGVSVLISPVNTAGAAPEPAELSLLALGLPALWLLRRKRA